MKHNIRNQNVPNDTLKKVEELISIHQNELNSYIDQLFWWNKRVNLISRSVPRETIWHHIAHSLLISVLKPFKENKNMLDAGSGGGLPGLPLAISWPKKTFIVNDINSKKTIAVKQIARQLGLENVSVINASIDDVHVQEKCVIITKHAFKINTLMEMIDHINYAGVIFYKGIPFKNELKGIEHSINITVHHLNKSNKSPFFIDKVLITIKKAH